VVTNSSSSDDDLLAMVQATLTAGPQPKPRDKRMIKMRFSKQGLASFNHAPPKYAIEFAGDGLRMHWYPLREHLFRFVEDIQPYKVRIDCSKHRAFEEDAEWISTQIQGSWSVYFETTSDDAQGEREYIAHYSFTDDIAATLFKVFKYG
jgi:hypothetical protein